MERVIKYGLSLVSGFLGVHPSITQAQRQLLLALAIHAIPSLSLTHSRNEKVCMVSKYQTSASLFHLQVRRGP